MRRCCCRASATCGCTGCTALSTRPWQQAPRRATAQRRSRGSSTWRSCRSGSAWCTRVCCGCAGQTRTTSGTTHTTSWPRSTGAAAVASGGVLLACGRCVRHACVSWHVCATVVVRQRWCGMCTRHGCAACLCGLCVRHGTAFLQGKCVVSIALSLAPVSCCAGAGTCCLCKLSFTHMLPCICVATCRKTRVVHIKPGCKHPTEDPSFEVCYICVILLK